MVGNAIFDPEKMFYLDLSIPTSSTIAKARGIGTIVNTNPAPAISINDVSVKEGNNGTSDATFTVSLKGATALPVNVHYVTADGTAKAPADYQSISGDLSFAPGETSKTVIVKVVGNTIYELDKLFYVDLSTPVNATVNKGRGTGTILNDDPLPTLSINDVQVKKNTSGTTDAVFTISLNGATAVPVSIHYVTADGTAKAPGNYQSTSGDLNFVPGETSKTVAVKVVGNAIFEPEKIFYLDLSIPTSSTIAKAR